jgi:hypothetical protein
MDEIRAVAHLPNLDIEILHRRLSDEHAEQLLISLRVQPSFEALARWLDAPGPAVALWAPWLKAASRTLPDVASSKKARGAER